VSAVQRARRRQEGTVSHLAEIRRLRELAAGAAGLADRLAAVTAERDQLRAQLAALIEATSYDLDGYWRRLAAELAARAEARGVARGRALEAADDAARWRAVSGPVARGGPAWAEVEARRWGPGGRARFADPRPGDFPGFHDSTGDGGPR
jgi:hypothetical protein